MLFFLETLLETILAIAINALPIVVCFYIAWVIVALVAVHEEMLTYPVAILLFAGTVFAFAAYRLEFEFQRSDALFVGGMCLIGALVGVIVAYVILKEKRKCQPLVALKASLSTILNICTKIF